MIPRIEISSEKKLVGKHMTMSFTNFKIGELWQGFMPHRNEIKNKLNEDLISLVIYGENHFGEFHPSNQFERWAAVEVKNFENVPDGLQTFVLPAGMYAVFDYKGLNTDKSIFEYIYTTWLPSSIYELDNRPHFEVLGEKYKNNDPTSEEEIWIPVKLK